MSVVHSRVSVYLCPLVTSYTYTLVNTFAYKSLFTHTHIKCIKCWSSLLRLPSLTLRSLPSLQELVKVLNGLFRGPHLWSDPR